MNKKWIAFVEELRRRNPQYAALRYPETIHLGELRIGDEESLVKFTFTITFSAMGLVLMQEYTSLGTL